MGKVAVVTGSTHGAGLRIACRLAAGGFDLAINGPGGPAAAEMLRTDISNTYGIRVAFSPADVCEPNGATMLIEDVTKALGRVDILVNNAGIPQEGADGEFVAEQWNATIERNLTAFFFTTRAVLPQMFQRDWGRIINVASTYGPTATASQAAYVAAAHGVVGLTKCIAFETAATGITCNAICPDLLANRRRPPAANLSASGQSNLAAVAAAWPSQDERQPSVPPRNRLGDVAKFLCSDAAACLNGVALPVDGAWFPQ